MGLMTIVKLTEHHSGISSINKYERVSLFLFKSRFRKGFYAILETLETWDL